MPSLPASAHGILLDALVFARIAAVTECVRAAPPAAAMRSEKSLEKAEDFQLPRKFGTATAAAV